MDESLRKAATGKVNELYRVIQRNGNVLRCVDEVDFMERPLHIAAEEGCFEFAMEMMNLKPSFARKLNHQGSSPLHIAVRKGHKEMALRFLEIDKHLVRVRGKKASPDCIQDVTIENHTALHIAIQNNRLDVLQLLIPTLTRKDYYWEVVNRKDKDGNSALHIAAIYNQPKKMKTPINVVEDMDLSAMIFEVNMVYSDPREWLLDTCATCHICYDEDLFFELEPCKNREKLYMGNDATSKIKGKGTVVLMMTSIKELKL
ncbi:ankyrin repeat-containing protein BDA1-like [Gossypium arboreum]|uniref:ankyrin repeat-containing protein BDA1-like n=1 Tax=Gossypium arboreum TaxID=29729 RepID=UPI000819505A|nr:ankyrin repeat-containing protein BDA1-like [Gossypium arboreum]